MLRRLLACMAIVASVMVASLVALPRPVAAAVTGGCSSGSILGLPTWYEYLTVGPKSATDKDGNILKDKDGKTIIIDQCAITGPLNDPRDPKSGLDWGKAAPRIGLAVVDILLRLAGTVAVIFVIYGGIRLIISEGEPDNFKKAKESIFNALIGLLIVLVSTGAVNFVGNTLK